MDSGLSENFTDRVSPIQQHVDTLKKLGVEPGPLNPYVNAVTSDVVKVGLSVEFVIGKGRHYQKLNITDSAVHSIMFSIILCMINVYFVVHYSSRCLPMQPEIIVNNMEPKLNILLRLPARTVFTEHKILELLSK